MLNGHTIHGEAVIIPNVELQDLDNVQFSTPTNGQYLVYSGGYWVNRTVSATGSVTLNDTDDLAEGSSNLYFTEPRVRSTVLTGLSSVSGDVTASDSLLQAIGRIKYALANLNSTLSLSTSTLTNLTGYIKGDGLTLDASTTIPNTDITGLGTASTKDTGTSSGQVPLLGSGGSLSLAGNLSASNISGTNTGDQDLSTLLVKASNLSDLASASTARTNLGLGDSATRNVGTTAGTVCAGDDYRLIDGALFTDYRSTTTYGAGDIVLGSDGNYYRAVATATNQNPTTDSGTYWQLYRVTTNTTLNVASGGRFTLPSSAWNFVRNAQIHMNAFVTISMAAGTYSESASISIESPYASNVYFNGAGVSSTFIDFGSNAGFLCGINGSSRSGGTGISFDDFTLKGAWTFTGSGGSGQSGYQKTGFFTSNGGLLILKDVNIDGFYYAVQAANSGHIIVSSNSVFSNGGDVLAFAYDGGLINFKGTINVSGCSDAANGLGNGILAEAGGQIVMDGAVTFSNCRFCGIGAISGGQLVLKSTLTAGSMPTSGSYGIYIQGGRVLTYGAHTFTLSSIGSSSLGSGIYVQMGDLNRRSGTTTCSSNAGANVQALDGARLYFGGTLTTSSSASAAGIFARNGATVSARNGCTSSSNATYGAQHNGPGGVIDVTSWTATSNGTSATNITANTIFSSSGAFIKTS